MKVIGYFLSHIFLILCSGFSKDKYRRVSQIALCNKRCLRRSYEVRKITLHCVTSVVALYHSTQVCSLNAMWIFACPCTRVPTASFFCMIPTKNGFPVRWRLDVRFNRGGKRGNDKDHDESDIENLDFHSDDSNDEPRFDNKQIVKVILCGTTKELGRLYYESNRGV